MKKGISLIVLVITIIIMIIIAGAVILSLSGSDVTTKAAYATLASDRANYQAKYATLYAGAVENDGSIGAITSTELGFPTGWAVYNGEAADATAYNFTSPAPTNGTVKISLTGDDAEAKYGFEVTFTSVSDYTVTYNGAAINWVHITAGPTA